MDKQMWNIATIKEYIKNKWNTLKLCDFTVIVCERKQNIICKNPDFWWGYYLEFGLFFCFLFFLQETCNLIFFLVILLEIICNITNWEKSVK